jgi:hypothetical protein
MRCSVPLFAAVAVTLTVFTGPSFANRAAADACAAKLPAHGKLIYAATIPAVGPDVDLKDVIRAKTRALVMSGKLDRGQAPTAAQAAGVCLVQAM